MHGFVRFPQDWNMHLISNCRPLVLKVQAIKFTISRYLTLKKWQAVSLCKYSPTLVFLIEQLRSLCSRLSRLINYCCTFFLWNCNLSAHLQCQGRRLNPLIQWNIWFVSFFPSFPVSPLLFSSFLPPVSRHKYTDAVFYYTIHRHYLFLISFPKLC